MDIDDATAININEDYLQCVLRQKLNDPTFIVSKCNIKDGVSKGQGYLSNMLRVEVGVIRKGQVGVVNLIVKTLPTDASSEAFVSECTAFPNELRVFSETLPEMGKLLKSIGKPSEIGAELYYCRNAKPYVLIVEDLTAKGFKMLDRQKGLNLEQCRLALEALARYHAASVVLHDLNSESIERYKVSFSTEDFTNNFFEVMISQGLIAAAAVADSLFPNGENYGERLKQRAETLRRDTKNLFNLNRNNFNVLLHGDFWLNNMMFKYNEANGDIQEVKFVDFQLSRYASAGIDLQYFINSSPADDVRASYINHLLKSYHSELCETLTLLGYEHLTISFEQLLDEYEKNMAYGFMVAVTILPIFMADNDDDFDIPAVAENKTGIKGFHKRASNPLFTKILKRLLPIFDKSGIF